MDILAEAGHKTFHLNIPPQTHGGNSKVMASCSTCQLEEDGNHCDIQYSINLGTRAVEKTYVPATLGRASDSPLGMVTHTVD